MHCNSRESCMWKERGHMRYVSRFGDGKIADTAFASSVKYEVRKSNEVEVGGIIGLRRKEKKHKIHFWKVGEQIYQDSLIGLGWQIELST